MRGLVLYVIISIAEAFLLVLLSWPLIWLLKDRELRLLFVRQEFMLAGLLLSWFCIIVILASLYPMALHVLSAISLAIFAALAWRGRVAYGKTQGLPPGSLALAPSISAIANRQFYLQQARQHGPVCLHDFSDSLERQLLTFLFLMCCYDDAFRQVALMLRIDATWGSFLFVKCNYTLYTG